MAVTATPRRLADLPGPRGWPLIGNALQLRPAKLHQQFEALCRDFGPLVRMKLGRFPALLVGDHELLAAVLRDRPERFDRPAQTGRVVREMGLPTGVFSANGAVWARQRRMVMAGFDPSHVRAYFPALLGVTGRLQARWQRAARAGSEIDLQSDLMRYTVDAIAGLAFGAEVRTLEAEEDVIQRHLDLILPAVFKRALSPLPYWRWFKLPADRRLDRAVAEVKTEIASFIAQARARLDAEPARRAAPPNLLEAMIVAADRHADDDAVSSGRKSDSPVSDGDVAGNVITMLLAGEDTTANTLAWMIDLLWRHPQTLKRARDEVLRLTPGLGDFSPERLGELDYLEACILETMRLKPVAPLLAAQARRETRVGDVLVPAGTVVWGVMRHASLNEQHFPEAATFKPERWLAANATTAATTAATAATAPTSSKRVAMPFGAGPRICPGRYLAMLEMKMALAMLLGHFEIDAVSSPGGSEPAERLSFTLEPVGLTMRLRERN